MVNNWFKVKCRYTAQQSNGTFKRVTEERLFSAVNFTDAETRIFDELGSIIRGEFNVVGINPYPVVDIFHFEDSDLWWEIYVRVQDPSLDSEKIKMISAKYLVSGNNITEALNNVEEELNKLISDYTITGIKSSNIIDIFPYVENLDREVSRTAVTGEEEVMEVEYEDNSVEEEN